MTDKVKLQARPQMRQSAPDYVIDQIRQALVEGRLKPGDRVPAETELEQLYGVSRGSIRQAMKSLEMLGVVSIRPGDGTYVNDGLSKNSFNPLVFALLLSKPSKIAVSEARYALERDIIELILNDEERTKTVIPLLRENLEHHLELLRENADVATLVENDQAFHRIFSENCGNPVLEYVYDYVMDAFENIMVATTSIQESGGENVTIRDHTAILQAIEQRDYPMAKQAVSHSAATWLSLMQSEN